MRSEAEMLDLIVGYAKTDDRVRAVALGGSRVAPGAVQDCFSDYDVIFGVTDVAGFTANHSWVDVFGERAILQMPETNSMPDYPPDNDGHFTYLMQFTDGTRIDLSLYPLEQLRTAVTAEPNRPLLDKDGLLAGLFGTPPDSSMFYVQKPTAANYADCCNEFWWVSPYVAKGLWRGQMVYALRHLDQVLRPMLYHMLSWQAGAKHNFAISVGSMGKYLPRYLPAQTTDALFATYRTDTPDACWDALFGCGALFRQSAQAVGAALGYPYPQQDDDRVSVLLAQIRAAGQGVCPF